MYSLLFLILSSVVENNIKYCFDSTTNSYSVGCASQAQDAIKDKSLNLSTLIIPEKINNKDITKINTAAFCNLSTIRVVQIYAKITIIATRAFDQCSGLERINSPSTVKIIDGNALCLSTSIGTDETKISEGTVHIYFEPGSQLEKIGSGGISSKETIIITYCGNNTNITCGGAFLYGAINISIYNPYSLKFCNIPSTEIEDEEQEICPSPPPPPTLLNTPLLTLDWKQVRVYYAMYFMIMLG